MGVRAGANILVAGSSIFLNSDGVIAAMNKLRTSLDFLKQNG